ncbi:hypothetical protein VTK26DRAFT_7254 [Humicola hyalothermophila]
MPPHMQSSGRGGAGNMVASSQATQLQPEDLQTPTLKTPMVTTGRGGTGNMAANLDAEEKRRLQDVEPVVRTESHGSTVHIGRGGTGNTVKAGPDNDTAVADAASPPAIEKTRKKDEGEEEEKEEEEKSGSGDGAAATAAPNGGHKKADEPGLVEKGMNLLFGKK